MGVTTMRLKFSFLALVAVAALALLALVAACSSGGDDSSPRSDSPYEAAILDVDGVFFVEVGFTQEAQVNRTWFDPARGLACEEIFENGQYIGARFYENNQQKDITAGRGEAEGLPISKTIFSVLPYLGALAAQDHMTVEERPRLVLEATARLPESGLEATSRVELDPDTLFPIRSVVSVETMPGVTVSSEFLYENSQVVEGRLDPGSRGTCLVQ